MKSGILFEGIASVVMVLIVVPDEHVGLKREPDRMAFVAMMLIGISGKSSASTTLCASVLK